VGDGTLKSVPLTNLPGQQRGAYLTLWRRSLWRPRAVGNRRAPDRGHRTHHVQIYGRPIERRIDAYIPTSGRHLLPWCFRGASVARQPSGVRC